MGSKSYHFATNHKGGLAAAEPRHRVVTVHNAPGVVGVIQIPHVRGRRDDGEAGMDDALHSLLAGPHLAAGRKQSDRQRSSGRAGLVLDADG